MDNQTSSESPFRSLWVEAYRPRQLTDVIISEQARKYLESLRDGEIPHLMLYGPAGLGKTSVAKIIAFELLKRDPADVLYINASDKSGIDVIRNEVRSFAETTSMGGGLKIVILDEIDGLTSVSAGGGRSSAQQALRNTMEEFAHNVRFIATCNYIQNVISPIRSRCTEIEFGQPPIADILRRSIEILHEEHIVIPDSAKAGLHSLVQHTYPDIRKMINELQKCSAGGTFNPHAFDRSKDFGFAESLLTAVRSQADAESMRKLWIGHEQDFANDYLQLLRDLFEVCYQSTALEDMCKREILLLIADAMEAHPRVMDQEINFYAVMLRIQDACK